ncbi:hypothetical protein AC1031_011295 [Aphanomyces cochlioides]|nr:hypothetical protein AC1031_011295 [Aphanomyces cochlioides]
METSESSSSSDEDMMNTLQVLVPVVTAINESELLVDDSVVDESQGCVNRSIPARDIMSVVSLSPYIFKVMTNFTQTHFEEFCRAVYPIILGNARTTGLNRRSNSGRPPKLPPEQRLLAFVLHLKHDNTTTFESVNWNWSRNPLHKNWFNGRKHMYCFNNTVVVDHNGLFIFEDNGYPGKYHDDNILRQSFLYKNWRNYFTVSDSYFEYLLGDPGYVGEEMFIMRRVGTREFADHGHLSRIHLFNKMHAGVRIKVEWGIGGLKRK